MVRFRGTTQQRDSYYNLFFAYVRRLVRQLVEHKAKIHRSPSARESRAEKRRPENVAWDGPSPNEKAATREPGGAPSGRFWS